MLESIKQTKFFNFLFSKMKNNTLKNYFFKKNKILFFMKKISKLDLNNLKYKIYL